MSRSKRGACVSVRLQCFVNFRGDLAMKFSNVPRLFALALTCVGCSFAQSYTGCSGNPPTGQLQLWVVNLDFMTGLAEINGVDVRRPQNTPFTWRWGDGVITQGWFLQSHTYASAGHPYTLQVVSHEDDGSTDCAQILIDTHAFFDNFDRPDGAVGNGWISYNGATIAGAQLQSYGGGSGVYRSVRVTFPVSFSFDFRTESTGDTCHNPPSPYNDGGWGIAFNSPTGAIPPYNGAQLFLFQYAGSQPVSRSYLTNNGLVGDSGGPSGLPDFTSSFTHVSGIVNADLSATITVGPSTFTFPAAKNQVTAPPGSELVLSNVNCTPGPDFFDNFSVRSSCSPNASCANPPESGVPSFLYVSNRDSNNISAYNIVSIP